ncbi:MAG: hypothetical protein QOG65_1727 [Actinomycetota bacterium]|jgi:uncharacterized protein (TIGR03086 family)|nr:hypothetical protein [Actinomycetota bacterium]
MTTPTTAQTSSAPGARALDRDPRPLFMAATTTATEVIGAIRPEQLTNPTPCAEFDVRDLLGHLVGVVQRVAAMGRGNDPMTVGELPEVADSGWASAWRAAVDDADDAWRDESALERTIVLPWATDSGANALLGYVSEITVHTWDLAQGTGQHPVWDDDTAERALRLMHQWLPGEHRAEIFAEVRNRMGLDADTPDAFAAVVPVPDDASPIDRLVAWNGRRP